MSYPIHLRNHPPNRRWRLFQNKPLYKPLAELDPEVQNIIDKETWRQFTGLELIASEVCFLRRLSRQ